MANAPKKKFPPLPKAPRSTDEINAEYGQLIAKAGQSQYQIKVYQQDLDRLNNRLFELNYEAAARNELDAKQAKVTEVKSNE